MPDTQETCGSGRFLEKEMAAHSRILAWSIPWTEKPGRLPSTGLQRFGHDWAYTREKDQLVYKIWHISDKMCPLKSLSWNRNWKQFGIKVSTIFDFPKTILSGHVLEQINVWKVFTHQCFFFTTVVPLAHVNHPCLLPVTHLATDLFQPVMYPSAYVQQALTSHNNGPKAQDSNAASSNILTVPNL